VAASEQQEQAGSEQYHEDHMGAIFKKGFSFSGYERDLLALNLGGGEFLNISGVSGIDSISDGRGSVFADLDNDGDLDVLLTTAQGEAHYLYRNNVGSRSSYLRVTLEGTRLRRPREVLHRHSDQDQVRRQRLPVSSRFPVAVRAR
jgi:hypothetical protein